MNSCAFSFINNNYGIFHLQQVKPLSDWEILKLNGPEWPLIMIGSIAAFIQGACFPVFALLFGFCSGVIISLTFLEYFFFKLSLYVLYYE